MPSQRQSCAGIRSCLFGDFHRMMVSKVRSTQSVMPRFLASRHRRFRRGIGFLKKIRRTSKGRRHRRDDHEDSSDTGSASTFDSDMSVESLHIEANEGQKVSLDKMADTRKTAVVTNKPSLGWVSHVERYWRLQVLPSPSLEMIRYQSSSCDLVATKSHDVEQNHRDNIARVSFLPHALALLLVVILRSLLTLTNTRLASTVAYMLVMACYVQNILKSKR